MGPFFLYDLIKQGSTTFLVKILLPFRASGASSIQNSITVGFKGALELPFLRIWGDFLGDFLDNF